ALPLCRCLGLLEGERLSEKRLVETIRGNPTAEVLEVVSALAGFKIMDKGGTRIGARMGRPEKAAPREMKPPVHVLFPIELQGGARRNILEAAEKGGKVAVELAQLKCQRCGKIVFTRKCPGCGGMAEFRRYCSKCGREIEGEACPSCGARGEFFKRVEIDVRELLSAAMEKVGEVELDMLKGVKGMTSAYKIPEPIEKGILRAKHKVFVFKDGTIRFDATNVPLTHLRPREIGVSVEKLRELGYERDVDGRPLERDDQLLELKVQDIILPEEGAEYLLRASRFVDELLQKFYGLPSYYKADRREDLLGHIVLGLAPHTSAGVVGRIIGFTKAKVYYAHPFFHAAKRRDCDGDEDCVMLLLDALLNFSKRFLPSSRGGHMDAPLILTLRINPLEIDKEAHNMDVVGRYPLEFYEATWRYEAPSKLTSLIETVEKRLGTAAQYEGIKFSFDTGDIAAGPRESKYSSLGEMEDKIRAEMELAEKIRAVDPRSIAEKIISHHFIPDMRGNLRTFSTQAFRCSNCNRKFRRVPLRGVCEECGGKLLLTVHRASVEKYFMAAKRLAEKYNLSDYTKQRIMLIERDIKSTFESDAVRQTTLADFF
ncbi:MAG: DNA polymerase II large subunit, partial [Candidatus Hadarchaeales archaeon]